MAIKVQDAGTLRTINGIKVKQAGVVRTIRQVKVQDGGVLRTVATFADPLAVTANNSVGVGSGTVTTSTSNAVVSGGFSPFTYAWTLITNGGGAASTANSPSSASTTFTKTGIGTSSGEVVEAVDVWRVTVTDAVGQTATDDVNASFGYLSGAQ